MRRRLLNKTEEDNLDTNEYNSIDVANGNSNTDTFNNNIHISDNIRL